MSCGLMHLVAIADASVFRIACRRVSKNVDGLRTFLNGLPFETNPRTLTISAQR